MSEERFWLSIWAIAFITIIIIASIIATSYYLNREMKMENFEKTIKDLTTEQKCLHICGFQWYGQVYHDRYKFCVEKCDRISERECEEE